GLVCDPVQIPVNYQEAIATTVDVKCHVVLNGVVKHKVCCRDHSSQIGHAGAIGFIVIRRRSSRASLDEVIGRGEVGDKVDNGRRVTRAGREHKRIITSTTSQHVSTSTTNQRVI